MCKINQFSQGIGKRARVGSEHRDAYRQPKNSECQDLVDNVQAILNTNVVNRKVKFLVDTGASLSLIAGHILNKNVQVKPIKPIVIRGVVPGTQDWSANGELDINININNKIFTRKFFVINGGNVAGFDGIIGRDILFADAKVDIYAKKLYFMNPNETVYNLANHGDEVAKNEYGVSNRVNESSEHSKAEQKTTVEGILLDGSLITEEITTSNKIVHKDYIIEDVVNEIKHDKVENKHKIHEKDKIVKFGTINQNNYQFDVASRGNQCTAMAMTALVYAAFKSVNQWMRSDIDYIVSTGDHVYRESFASSNQKHVHLAADEIISMIKIKDKLYKTKCILDLTSIGHFDNLSLGHAFTNFFSSYKNGILTFGGKSFAIFKSTHFKPEFSERYSIFDSHGIPASKNQQWSDAAVVLTFTTLRSLIKWFYNTLANSNVYSIVPIKISQEHDHLMSKFHHKDQINYFDATGKHMTINAAKSGDINDLMDSSHIFHNTQQRDRVIAYLHKRGYINGKGLGKRLQGIISPIKASDKHDRAGLGYVSTGDDEWQTGEILKWQNGRIIWTDFVRAAADGMQKRIAECGTQKAINPIAPVEIADHEHNDRDYVSATQLHNHLGHYNIDTLKPKSRAPVFDNIPKVDMQFLPPRTETILKVVIPEKGARVCHSKEIVPGVFIANSIIKSDNGHAWVGCLNTRFDMVAICEQTPHTETVAAYNWPTSSQQTNAQRLKLLHENLRINKGVTDEQYAGMKQICEDFVDIFHLPGDHLTCTNVKTFKLPLVPEADIINIRQYRLPETQKTEVQKQVEKMMAEGIIEKSISPYNSPMILVPKKAPEGSNEKVFRLCIDYRRLNKVAKPYQFPLPRIDEILDKLGKTKYFSTLDLSQGFHQVLIDKADREKTAFSTTYGHYQYRRCPFGLKTLPGFFQSLLNSILTGLQGVTCFVYIDDVVIFGQTIEEHNEKLIEVFSRFRDSNLKLNPLKCQFLEQEVSYLGHKCSIRGVEPDTKLTDTIKKFPRPTSAKQVQSFHGLANYYRKFIKGFADIASPLYTLMKKETEFKWTDDCEKAFCSLKNALTSEPILVYPDFSKEFTITTDASAVAVGAILEQEGRVVYYASQTLTDQKKRWSATELELHGVLFGCKTFRHYVLGRHFKIFTDHMPLRGQIKLQNASSRIIKMMESLSEFDFEIAYKKGKINTNADCLSRIPPIINTDSDTDIICIVQTRRQKRVNEEALETIKKLNDEKRLHEEVVKKSNDDKNEVIIDSDVENITDDAEKQELMRAYHDGILGGHFGTDKTYKKLRAKYQWTGMKRDVERYIGSCHHCQSHKSSRPVKMPLKLTDISIQPFDKIFIDIVGPLPISNNGNKYILSMVDDLTRFVEFAAIPDQQADTIARALFEQILCRYNIPKEIVTDNGTNFVGKVFNQLCKMFGVKKLRTTAYHPQANLVERQHSTMGNYIRIFVDDHPTTWDVFVRSAAHAYNTTPHISTGFAPMEVLFGFVSDIPTNLQRKPEPLYNLDSYCAELKYKLRYLYNNARQNVQAKKVQSKHQYDKKVNAPQLCVGDMVLRINKHRTTKLDKRYEGPFEVKAVHNDINITITQGKKEVRIHRNLVKKYEPRTVS